MSNEKREVAVDLSDDDATLDEIEQEAEQGPPTPDEEEPEAGGGEDTQSIHEKAQDEAARQYKAAEGPDREARLEAAITNVHEAIQTHAQQLQQFKSERADTEDRIDRLELTKERVRDQPADAQVLQTLAGGITLEVAVDDDDGFDREDLIGEIDETIEAAESYVDTLGDRVETMGVEIKKAQEAGKLLQQSLEKERQKSNSTEALREEIEHIDRERR